MKGLHAPDLSRPSRRLAKALRKLTGYRPRPAALSQKPLKTGLFSHFCSRPLRQTPEEKTVDGRAALCDKDTAHEIGKAKNMKAKAILAAGLMMAAAAAQSTAQTVFSVNAVGFVNVTCPPGFSIIANPLEAGTNTVQALLPSSLPPLAAVFKFDNAGGAFQGSIHLGGGNWTVNSMTLVPGEGFFFKNPAGTNITITFVGNVKQGTLATPLPQGFSLVGSQVPQSGLVSTDLGMPAATLDGVFRYNNAESAYDGYIFLGGTWTGGGEPTINVGEGFFVKKQSAATWTRSFSVNQ